MPSFLVMGFSGEDYREGLTIVLVYCNTGDNTACAYKSFCWNVRMGRES